MFFTRCFDLGHLGPITIFSGKTNHTTLTRQIYPRHPEPPYSPISSKSPFFVFFVFWVLEERVVQEARSSEVEGGKWDPGEKEEPREGLPRARPPLQLCNAWSWTLFLFLDK